MSDPLSTSHLDLPFLAPAQAQKHVTHNEALKRLDTVVQLAVLGATLATPPTAPEEGDRYIVGSAATGAWAGKDGQIAAFLDGAWDFATPKPGWIAFDLAAEAILVRQDDGWHGIGGFLGAVDRFGVNATPDDTNRLAVRSNAVLFSGIEAADGGTGDLRFTVNKETDADTASLLFQSGWSGRAEIGLAGDTDFVFKVSGGGSAWTEAIRIDKDTGHPTILYDNAGSGLVAGNVQDAIDEIAAGGGGVVSSVFGRAGAVVAATSDYDASQVDNDSSVSGATVKDALDGLAGAISGKQASDSDLTAVAGLSTTGLIARTGSGTAATRTIAAPAAGIAVSNGDGVAGNPTLALANDLAAYEGLAATGLVARTGDGSASARTLTAPAAGIAVSNGDGVAGNPTLALANDLSALEGLSSTGIAKRTGTDTWAVGAGVADLAASTANRLFGTDGAGASGLVTLPAAGLALAAGALALANDLAALEGLSSTGLARRTASDTWDQVGYPTATTDNTLPRFDGTVGNVQTSGIAVSDANALAGVAGLNGGQLAGFRNLLINPYGRINQRGAASNADDTYGHDRWNVLTQTGTIAVSTVSDAENGTPKMWRLTQSQASAQRMGYSQIIEAANCKHLRGKSVTLSGRVKFSLNAALRYAILEWTGTEDAVTSDVVNDWTNGVYTAGNFFLGSNLTVSAVGSITPSSATLTELTTLTAMLGSSFNNLIVLIWTEGTAAQNATLDGALQLEVTDATFPAATPREHRSFQIELALCQWYYRVFGGVAGFPYVMGYDATGGHGWVSSFLFPTMRAAPTGTKNGTWAVDNCGQPSVSATAKDGMSLLIVASAAGVFAANPNSADDTISLDAEL
jgi:hypothetical protein